MTSGEIQNTLLVSVVMITYKHEKFIVEAIEGVLMQECDFDVELIIADDCSPDKTEEIVQHYIANHPKGHWIKYHRHEKNIGMMPNFVWALNQAKGEFIALCEGDDYWVSKSKLQTQIGIFISNPKVSLCHTLTQDSKGDIISKKIELKKGEISKLAEHNFILTASVMFKREILTSFNWMHKNYPFGDWPLWLTAITIGDIVYLDELCTVYRVNEIGVWQNNWKDRIGSDRLISEVELLEEFTNTFHSYKAEVNSGILIRLRKLVVFYMSTGSYGLIFRHPLKRMLKPYTEFQSIRKQAKINYIKSKFGL